VKTIAELKQEASAIRAERNAEIEAIKNSCAQRLDEIGREIKSIPPRPKPTALDRYTEPDGAPVRHCRGCGDELLPATLENAQRIYDSLLGFSANWASVRRMAPDSFCCRCCKNGDGHSCWCTSKAEIEERESEKLTAKAR
jgi:hypothetical protein